MAYSSNRCVIINTTALLGLNFLKLTKSKIDRIKNTFSGYPLYYKFHLHHHNTDIWRLLTFPATSKPESLLGGYIYANYSGCPNDCCIAHLLSFQASL